MILGFVHANDHQMDRHQDNDFLFHYTSQYIMATGTYTQLPDEIKAKMSYFWDHYCFIFFDLVTPKQGSLNATLTTYCSPTCTEAQCNQSNPKKWKVSLGRCSHPLI